jgi:hypothetical protein
MSHARPERPTPFLGAVAGVVTLAVLGVAFSLHALDVAWAWVVYPLGFGGLLPLALGVARHRAPDRPRPSTRDDALETLRDRYARGEIDEAEFEARVERLLETETTTDARDRYGYPSGESTSSARTTRSR